MRRTAPILALLFAAACGGGAGTAPDPTSPDGAQDKGTRRDGAPIVDGAPDSAAAQAEGPPPSGTYRIVLERPIQVGATYRRTVRVTDSRHETLIEGKKTLRDVDHRVQITLIGAEKVLAVGDRGRWQKIELKVATFAAAGAKGDEPIVPPGTLLTIVRGVGDGEPTMTSSAGDLSKDARKALSLAIPSSAKNVSDDEIFGSAEPRAPGASWDVARDVAARDIGARGVQTRPELIEGNTRLMGTRDDRGVPCLEMAARMNVKISGFTGLPEGTTVERGLVTAEITGIVPVDVTKQAHRSTSRVGIEVVAKVPVEKSMATLTIEGLSVRETTYE